MNKAEVTGMEDWIFVQLERILGLGRLLRARREADAEDE